MNGTLRRSSIGLLALLSIAVMGTALAWACSDGNKITIAKQSPAPASGPPGSGPVGSQVTLEGDSFIGGEAVEIRWNELDGPLLAKETVPAGSTSFKTDPPITIPQAPADTHVILAKTTNKEGKTFVARTTFTVTEAGAPAGGGGSGTGSRPTSPGAPPVASPGPRSPGSTRAPQAGRGNTNGGVRPGGGRDSATVTGPGTGSRESNRAPTTGVSPAVGTKTRRSGLSARADATSAGASADSGPPRGGAADSPGGGGTDRGAASELSASGDLWGGFSSASQRPSLSGAAGPEAETNSSFTLGLGLLGLGLVALFAGFGAADVRRRRRVTSSAQGRSRQR